MSLAPSRTLSHYRLVEQIGEGAMGVIGKLESWSPELRALHKSPEFSPDGRLLAFLSDESGKNQTYVVAFHADGSTGRPVAVTAGPGLSVSAPTLVHDFDKLRVRTQIWNVLPDGRFFVGLKHENEDEITRYSLVLNWTEVLKQKMEAAR